MNTRGMDMRCCNSEVTELLFCVVDDESEQSKCSLLVVSRNFSRSCPWLVGGRDEGGGALHQAAVFVTSIESRVLVSVSFTSKT